MFGTRGGYPDPLLVFRLVSDKVLSQVRVSSYYFYFLSCAHASPNNVFNSLDVAELILTLLFLWIAAQSTN